MNMIISGVVDKDGEKMAYVNFEDGGKIAEGQIPKCVITKNTGFTDEEVGMLTEYMKENLATLKREAAKINPLRALMSE